MDAQSIMRPPQFCLEPNDTALRAARLMIAHHRYALPVVAGERALVGVLRVADLIALALPAYLDEVRDFSFLTSAVEWSADAMPDLSTLTVGEMLARRTPQGAESGEEEERRPHVVDETEPLVEVARLFAREGALLCPVQHAGEFVGVIDPHDLLCVLIAPWEGEPATP